MSSQKILERVVWGVVIAVAIYVLVSSRSLGNIVASLFLLIFLVAMAFWSDTLVRQHLNPLIDSINESISGRSQRTEYFPLSVRILIWGFVGLLLAYAWSRLVPLVFTLPLLFSRVALSLGGKTPSMVDSAWQWGWSLFFVVCYLVNMGVGFMRYSRYRDFKNLFDYPDE